MDDLPPTSPRLVGSTDPLYQNTPSSFFKSAQWSTDGTTLLTSLSPSTLSTFILPPTLLDPPSPSPHALTPYTTHTLPSPAPALAIHPLYTLSTPPTCLYLASQPHLPTRLLSPFAPGILSSYPLVSPTTEAFTAPHSLLFSPAAPNTFFAGADSSIAVFDLSRDGEGPVARMRTGRRKGRRARGGAGAGAGPAGGMRGIVSAMGMSRGGMLAAGTFARGLGLYDGFGRGGEVAVFAVQEESVLERGLGVTQVLWSACGRYLVVAERGCGGVGVWDVRGSGRRLAWLAGREAATMQRMGVEVLGGEVWAGGTDGGVRMWDGLGMREGVVEPAWGFRAHGDVVSAAVLHPMGGVLATCSGSRHFDGVDDAVKGYTDEEDDGESERTSSGSDKSSRSLSVSSYSQTHDFDNSLKLWAL